MHPCMHACTHTHTLHTHTHTHTHTCMHLCVLTWLIHSTLCMHTQKCTHTNTHTHKHTKLRPNSIKSSPTQPHLPTTLWSKSLQRKRWITVDLNWVHLLITIPAMHYIHAGQIRLLQSCLQIFNALEFRTQLEKMTLWWESHTPAVFWMAVLCHNPSEVHSSINRESCQL